MENKDQNPLNYSGGLDDQSVSVGTVHQAPEEMNSLSAVPGEVLLDTQNQKPKSQVGRFLRFARRLDVILVVLLILGGAGTYFTLTHVRSHNNISNGAGNFADTKIPLGEIIDGKNLSIGGAANVTINGQLQLNDSLALAPTLQPTGAKTGEIYFDKSTNQLAYFNGSEFVFLTGTPASGLQTLGTVQSIGGINGQITLGDGLAINGSQLSSTGVLTVQGQSGNVALTAGPGIVINGTNFSNSGVLSVSSTNPQLTVSNDGNGNVSLTVNTVPGSGTVTSGGGTNGNIAMFTGSQNIENSIITQSGLTVTISGDLSVVTGGLSLSNALTVPNGGTGTTSLAANGVLVGQGTAAVNSVTAGSAGLCLLSTAGAPVWGACPSGNGVNSLNGLNGALTLANASAAGSTITIDNASTTTKGIASFNGTNFTASGGNINTIQDINSGATPTFAGVNTNIITPNAALTVGVSAQTALLQGSTTTIKSNGVGNDIVLDSANAIDLQDNTFVSGDITTSGNIAVNGGNLTSTGALNITPGGALSIGATSQALTLQGGATSSFHVASGANTTILGFTSPTANTTLNFPALAAGTYTICTTSGNCAGAGVTLQAAYSNSSNPEITLDATRGALTVRDNSTPIGANLLEVQNNTGSATYFGVTSAGVAVSGTATVSSNINSSTGALQTNGTTRVDNSGNLINIANVTAGGSATFQGGGVTIGTTSQAGSLALSDGSSNNGTLQTASLAQDTTYILPDPGTSTATVCLTTGNCAGSGGGVTTGGGTTNKLAKFTGSQSLGDSSISDNGTNVTVAVDVIVQGGDLTLGTTSQPASIVLHDGNGQTTTLQAGDSSSNLNFILPTNAGNANQCLKQSGTGNQLVWQDCDGGAGGSSASLQTAYNNSTNPEITLSSGVGGLTIRDNSTPVGGNLFEIQNNLGSTTYLGVTVTGVTVAGTASATGNINSSAGALQTNGTTRIDNSGNAVNIGNITGSGAITIASVGAGNNVTIDGSNQFVVQDASVFNALTTFNANIDMGTHDIVGTTGNITLTNFAVNGTNGNVTSGTVNGQTISSSANFTGTVAVAGNTTLTGDIAVNGGDITSTGALNITPSGTLTVGATGQQLVLQGSASTTLTANSGGFATAVGFSGVPTANVTYNFDRTPAAGTYTICTSIGNCAGSGGGVTTGGGTTGTLPVFTGSQTLGNSLLSQSGGTVTVNGNLNLVTGNQYKINGTQIASSDLSNDANLAKLSASETFTGATVAFQNTANSTNAFNVQNAAGNRILTVNTTGAQVVLGSSNSLDGSLVFANMTNSNTVTILPGAPTANRTLTLPNASGIICTDSGNCAGAGATLQTGYNFSTGGTTPKIKVNSTLLGVDIQDADTTIGADLFDVRASNASGLGSVMFGVGNTGALTLQNSSNSTAAFRLLTSGGTSVLTGDTTNGQIIVGQSGTLAGTLIFKNATNSNAITLTSAVATGAQTVTLPNASGTICLNSGNCSGAGSSNTLQAAYDAGNTITTSNARDVSFTLADTATDSNFLVNLQCTTSCGSNGRFAVQNSGTDVFTISPASGAVLLRNSANSTTALALQNAAGTQVIAFDTVNDGSALFGLTTATKHFQVDMSTNDGKIDLGATGGNLHLSLTQHANGTAEIDHDADLVVKGNNNSTTNFQIQNASGSTLLNADTTNGRIGIGGVASFSKFEVLGGDAAIYNNGGNPRLILGNSTSAGQNGYLQYDSANNYFRIETVGTNGVKINDNYVTIGNIFPDQPLKVANGSTLLFQVNTTGSVLAKTSTNSTAAFQVQNAATTAILGVDTTGNNVNVNGNLIAAGIQPASVTGNGTAGSSDSITAATGGNTSGTTGQSAGNGGSIFLTAGDGGTAPSGSSNGWGGNVLIAGGAPGAGAGSAGLRGNVILQGSGGVVGIGTVSPNFSYKLDVAGDINISSGSSYRINGTAICTSSGCTPAAGSGNYIQNQNASQQSSSNFWISGTGRADTGLQAPSFDTASGTSTLQLAMTNATSIELGHSTFFANGAARTFNIQQALSGNNGDNLTVAAGSGNGTNKNGGALILQGGNSTGTGTVGSVIVRPQTDTATAFQVQNAAATSTYFDVDTINGRVGIGTTTPSAQLDVAGKLPTTSLANAFGTNSVYDVLVQGRYAYTANFGGFQVFDISRPAAPASVGSVSITTTISHLAGITGHYAVALVPTWDEVDIIDVSNPASPVKTTKTVTAISDAAIQGRYMYATTDDGSNNFKIFDMTTPTNPVLVSSLSEGSNAGDYIAVAGNYAYVTQNNGVSCSLQVIDISNPAAPVNKGSVSTSVCSSIAVQGKYAYIIGGTTLQAVNVSNPASPTSVATFTLAGTGNASQIKLQDKYAYVALGSDNLIQAVDISNPASMASVGTVTTTGTTRGLAVNGRYIYAGDATNNKLYVYDMGGAYVQQLEVGGIQTGTISVDGRASVAGQLDVTGGIRSGAGLGVTGDASVNGNASFQAQNDNSSVFKILNASGNTNIFSVDSTNSGVATLFGTVPGETNPWSTNATSLPGSRYGGSTTIANGYIYFLGGDDNSNVTQTAVYYAKLNADGSVGSWTTSANPLPSARARSYAFVSNGYIYMVGGADSSFTSVTTIYYARLNPDGSTGAWQTATNGLPSARQSGTAVIGNGYLYYLGGQDSSATTQPTVYYSKLNADGSLGSWTTSANPLPSERYFAATTIANGYIYEFGGTNNAGTQQSTVYYSKISATDGSNGAWQTNGNALPSARAEAAPYVANGYVYLAGGEDSIAYRASIFYARLNADGTIGTWSTSANALPGNRASAGSAVANGYFYNVSGYSGAGATSTIFYTTTSRVQIGASLDLVSLDNQNLTDGNGSNNTNGSMGGSITAGNGRFVGGLDVIGAGNFAGTLNVSGAFSAKDTAAFQVGTNTAGAFQVLNAGGVPLFSIDTSSNRVYVGNPTADTTGALLVLDNQTSSTTDPTGVNGAMYYNAADGAFRCYENGAWRNCLESGRTAYHYTADMIGTVSDNNAGYYTSNSGTFSGSAVAGTPAHPGIVQLGSGTTTNGQGAIGANDTGQSFLFGGGTSWTYETALLIPTLSNGTDTFAARAGFYDGGGTDGTDGCLFKYSNGINSGKWQGICENNTTQSTCDTTITVAANTWYRLNISINSAGTAAIFSVTTGGTTTSCTISSNIPTATGRETSWNESIVKSAGTTARTVNVDYIDVRGEINGGR